MPKGTPFFTADHGQASSFETLPEGEYELICSKVEVKKSQSGNDMIAMELTIRDDVDQEGKKRKIFNNLVFTDKTGGIVQGALKAFGAEHGQSFSNIGEMAKFFQHKPVRAKLRIEKYTANDGSEKETNRVAFFTKPQAGSTVAVGSTPLDIKESDLPF